MLSSDASWSCTLSCDIAWGICTDDVIWKGCQVEKIQGKNIPLFLFFCLSFYNYPNLLVKQYICEHTLVLFCRESCALIIKLIISQIFKDLNFLLWSKYSAIILVWTCAAFFVAGPTHEFCNLKSASFFAVSCRKYNFHCYSSYEFYDLK